MTGHYALCEGCWSAIGFIEAPYCERCGLPFDVDPGPGTICAGCHALPNDFRQARSALRYDDASRDLILSFKHGGRLERVHAFVTWLARAGEELRTPGGIILPVPLHPARLWRRRYNQSALLAKGLAGRWGETYLPDLLERTRATPSQGAMSSPKARRRNVLSAFRVAPGRKESIKGREVLLIDDVYTTGATLNACARALKRAGAGQVDALTLARVVRPAVSTI